MEDFIPSFYLIPEEGKTREDKIVEFMDFTAPNMGSIPSDGFMLTRVVIDILYTQQIMAWVDHAISVKKIDRISYNNKKIELKSWYHHVNSDLFKYDKTKDDYQNLRFKIEQETLEFMKYTLCTDLYEFDGCAINVKHDALKFFLKK